MALSRVANHQTLAVAATILSATVLDAQSGLLTVAIMVSEEAILALGTVSPGEMRMALALELTISTLHTPRSSQVVTITGRGAHLEVTRVSYRLCDCGGKAVLSEICFLKLQLIARALEQGPRLKA